MLSKNKFILTIIVILLQINFSTAQEKTTFRRCGNYLANPNHDPALPKIASALRYQNVSRTEKSNLPAIVHVIYTNPNYSIGVGNNISYEQIASQFMASNIDLIKKNKNRSQTLEEFIWDASSLDVEIKRALYDPNGNVLNEEGVHRFYRDPGAKGYFSTSEVETIIANNIWDPTKYLNIWVTALPDGYLGYAFFPNILSLSGLDEVNTSEIATSEKDGVVIDYRYFGADGIDEFNGRYSMNKPYHLGRTLTHELGHYLGILHPWGVGSASANCSKTDYCDDTPKVSGTHQDPENFSYCDENSEFHTKYLCDTANYSSAQYQNFMDYTNDSCMTMFTFDQKARVDTVLVAAVSRSTLNANAPNAEVHIDDNDVIAGSDGVNKIVWTVPSEGTQEITGYILERSVDDQGFNYVSPILASTTRSYSDFLPSLEYLNKKVSYRVYAVNKNGFSRESNIIVIEGGIVGIKPIKKASFVVYPNPTKGVFTMDITDFVSASAVIEIYNTSGSLVKSINLDKGLQSIEIHLDNMPNGTYFIRLSSDLGVFNQRIIKQ
ncbi:M43 family zinc metalloprotease [Flammeovirga pacifica]|uniref:Fibronectin type-III domain-containing protein n=1 Tax=Flammeovirga pacifica TaxID=915059 RepID=A0A1S1YZP5_FLAPC|nr:M43 family zinc metalloprotease [Flammeovirga pacifica]OHX66470.1 hypothetical protein NH26_08930 [Flammeovirga pacifica]